LPEEYLDNYSSLAAEPKRRYPIIASIEFQAILHPFWQRDTIYLLDRIPDQDI
jgi:hypothetical protein